MGTFSNPESSMAEFAKSMGELEEVMMSMRWHMCKKSLSTSKALRAFWRYEDRSLDLLTKIETDIKPGALSKIRTGHHW